MKKHRMPFEHWEDEHAKLIRASKPPEFMDPDYYVEAHFHPPGSPTPYFLNKRCRSLLDRQGPFTGKYVDGEELVGTCPCGDAFIFCPGPSMGEVDTRKFGGCLTMAVNSAGFAIDPTYWVMAESAYARWLMGSEVEVPCGRSVIATARVAVCLRDHEIRSKQDVFGEVHVVRWEEEKVVPPRVPAVSVFNALVTAWQMGCDNVYLIGLDLSKDDGAYLLGVPHTDEGARNPFNDQIRALSQFKMPGMTVYNGSEASADVLQFEYLDYENIERAALDAGSRG